MKQIILIFAALCMAYMAHAQNIKVKVVLHSIDGYGQYEDFARTAVRALEEVLNSDEFKQRVLAAHFIKTNGLSNQQLYDTIMCAHEVEGGSGQDSVVDLKIRTISAITDDPVWQERCVIGSRSGTIGVDGGGDGVMAICPERLALWASENNVAELAGHYAHEYMHIIGFNHKNPLRNQKWREKTFVYQIGDIVTELVNEKIKKAP